ncbi:MAG: hypothetical protein KGL16_03225 [Acidobacteriota bacterium]|nr:hypothetical protein [Acidobacteriota bacterium]
MTRTPLRPRRRVTAIAAGLGLSAVVSVSVLGTTGAGQPPAASPSTVAAARSFLARFVMADGRVSRPGQGSDTVSEGQAYALLLAQVARQPATFARVWRWTAAHLQQPDGLLAWHANADGVVLSPTAASDADLLSAWALSRASGPGSSGYHVQARRLARAILARETIRSGPYLLAAGPWATGSPGTLDPSYWSPLALNGLARFTRDARWRRLAHGAGVYLGAITDGGALLPPDWARLQGNAATAEPAPGGGSAQVQYGLDAQRVVVWMATSCAAAERRLAARWWPLLAPRGRAGAIALGTEGNVIDPDANALSYVAAAAAAVAAGDGRAMRTLLGRARTAEAGSRDYYGGAWLALGDALLTTNALGGCAGKGVSG